MDKATPGTLWAWVYVQDEAGGNAWGLFSLVTGWYRYPVDLNTPLDVSKVNYVEVAFAGAAGAARTVYLYAIVLFNFTPVARSPTPPPTVTKSNPPRARPKSPPPRFRLPTPSSLRGDCE